jgi:hypothetical protein
MQTPRLSASYMAHMQTVDPDAVLPPDAIQETTRLRDRGIFARLSEAAVVMNRDKRILIATHLSNVKKPYHFGQLAENAASVVKTTSRLSTPDIC